MSSEVEEKQKQRFQFLHKLYELSDGDEYKHINNDLIMKELGIDRETFISSYKYLKGENLIGEQVMNTIFITHSGVKEIEQALSERDKPTEYFPAYNVIYIGRDMVSSQVVQDSPAASQIINIGKEKYPELKQVIEEIKKSIDELPLEATHKSELQSELITVEVQLSSPNPKPVIVNESVGCIRRILESVAGSAIAQGLLALLPRLIS